MKRLPEAEFEIHCDGGFVSTVKGPREEAWAETMYYVAAFRKMNDVVEVFEVTRKHVGYPVDGEVGDVDALPPKQVESTGVSSTMGKVE